LSWDFCWVKVESDRCDRVPKLMIPGTTAPDRASITIANNAIRFRDSMFNRFIFLFGFLIVSLRNFFRGKWDVSVNYLGFFQNP
jgi:hypothetical protein